MVNSHFSSTTACSHGNVYFYWTTDHKGKLNVKKSKPHNTIEDLIEDLTEDLIEGLIEDLIEDLI